MHVSCIFITNPLAEYRAVPVVMDDRLRRSIDIVAEFQGYMDSLQRQNFEGRTFYPPQSIKSWMKLRADGSPSSNADRLLSAVYHQARARPLSAPSVGQITEHHLLVFALLALPVMQCAHMLHVFKHHVTDESFHLMDRNKQSKLIKELENDGDARLPESFRCHKAVLEKFDELRWSFCPASLDNMDVGFNTSHILPFCRGNEVNKKGGTANVYHYKIQIDLVESPKLRNMLHSSLTDDDEFGQVCGFPSHMPLRYCPLTF